MGYQLIVQYKNIHISNTILTEQVIIRTMYVYAMTISEKETVNLRVARGIWEGFKKG